MSGDEEAPPELFHRSEKKSIKATELLLKGCALIAWTLELDFPNALLDFRLCDPPQKNQSDCVILGRVWKSAAPTSARRKTVDHVLGNNKKFFQSRWNRQRLGAIPPTSSRAQLLWVSRRETFVWGNKTLCSSPQFKPLGQFVEEGPFGNETVRVRRVSCSPLSKKFGESVNVSQWWASQHQHTLSL